MSMIQLETYVLHKLINTPAGELDLRELLNSLRIHFPQYSDKVFRFLLNLLRDNGELEFIEKPTKAYLQCFESAKLDKRIKDPARYCKERYPIVIMVRVTDAGKAGYAERVFCNSYCFDHSYEVALINMRSVFDRIGFKTKPPEWCPCGPVKVPLRYRSNDREIHQG